MDIFQVVCATEFSKITPIENGEIVVPLTKGRPSEREVNSNAAFQVTFLFHS